MYKTDSNLELKELSNMHFFVAIFLVPILLLAPASHTRKIGRIIGGKEAYAGQFPYAAAIYKSTSDGTYFCGGALLTQDWIVTAGQCVDGGELFSIYLGTTKLNSNDGNTLRLATNDYVLYPDYDPVSLANDIGLIKLRLPVTFTNYIRPVDFLPTGDLAPYTGTIALGWGQTNDETAGLVDDLNWVSVTVLSNEECRQVYGSQITDGMVCVDGNYNEGTCNGDSGGPLIQDIGRGYNMQVGVASFVSGNGCESVDPSGFTRIFPYTQWIYNTTGL